MKKFIGLFVAVFLAVGCLKADNTCPVMNPRVSNYYTVTTSTVQALDLTGTAQCPLCKIFVNVGNASGGKLWYDFGKTQPTGVTGSASMSAVAGATSLTYGPFVPGTYIFLFGTTSSVVAYLDFYSVP